MSRPRSALRDAFAEMVDSVALAVQKEWSDDVKWRHILDPYPMVVNWVPAEPDLTADWTSLIALATSGAGWRASERDSWAAGPEDLAGTASHLVDVFARVPTGRLVVLGEPGAGKTILLVRFVLDLLARRGSGEPVPVLLPMASWSPLDEDLFSWIEHRLVRDIPALGSPSPGRTKVSRARALLDAALIFPVLDGLDEMPDGLRGPAIVGINDALQPGQHVVLASRTDAYREAVQSPTGVEVKVAGAAGIRLSPLDRTVAVRYLRDSAGGRRSAARWDGVTAALASEPRSPVAEALTTPLMTALARAVYNPRPGERLSDVPRHPAELLDRANFPTRIEVERHLFDAFIPAVYRKHPDPARRSKWNTGQAIRWMTFLAHDLEHRQNGTTDLSWWRITGAVPEYLSGLTVGLVVGAVAAFCIPWTGWGVGLIVAVLTGLTVRSRISQGREGPGIGLAGGMVGGQVAAMVNLAIFGSGVGNTLLGSFVAGGTSVAVAVAPLGRFRSGLVGGFLGEIAMAVYERTEVLDGVRTAVGDRAYLLNGVALGLIAGLAAGRFNRRTPARGLRWSSVGFVAGACSGVLFGVLMWAKTGPAIGITCGVIAMIAGGLGGGLYDSAAPTDLTKATSPWSVLVGDRSTFLVSLVIALPVGLIIGLGTALSPYDPYNAPGMYGWRYGAAIGIANLIAIGVGLAFLEATWGGFLLARLWLAARGRIPVRLMAFLYDAHVNRGVLRQVGAVYQFRHRELQRHLAARWPGKERTRSGNPLHRSAFSTR